MSLGKQGLLETENRGFIKNRTIRGIGIIDPYALLRTIPSISFEINVNRNLALYIRGGRESFNDSILPLFV